jgi:Dyp-type peroxidase family
VFLLASDTVDNVNSTLARLQKILGSTISEIHCVQGAARPGTQEGHEHFGYMDGVSQPAINGFTTPNPGQQVLDVGNFLLGETGDTKIRPSWAKDGSFLAFRQLKQLVPEFQQFLADNPIVEPGVLTTAQGSALLGARMVGRWPSGAPIDLAPLFDDPVLASDPNQNNNFTFAHPGEDLQSNQTRCPFSAHIRKTRPRADFSPMNTVNHIIRGGIPYGPEVTAAESASGVSDNSIERGLAFVAYQSNLGQGFHFLQKTWADNPNFIFGKSDPSPGADPIIGALAGAPRVVSGLDPTNPNHDITLVTDFVVSRGGEYFFSPSLSAILNTISV